MTQDTNTDTDGGEWTLTDDNGVETTFDSEAKAREQKRSLEQLGADVTLRPPADADGGGDDAEDMGSEESASEPSVASESGAVWAAFQRQPGLRE